jgi:hypothetical protein
MEAALEDYLKSACYTRDIRSKNRVLVELFEDGEWASYPKPNFFTSWWQPVGAILVVADAEVMRLGLPAAVEEAYGWCGQ